MVIGIGGLGHLGVQILRALTATRIIAVDSREEALQLGKDSGADHVVTSGATAKEEILEITKGRGADLVVDMVGVDDSLALAAAVSRPLGHLTLVGIGGGSLPFSFFALPYEVSLATTYWGTLPELMEVIALAEAGHLRPHVERHALQRGARGVREPERRPDRRPSRHRALMYEQIIVPLDRSDFAEAALPVAQSLAAAFGGATRARPCRLRGAPTEEQAYLDAVASSMSVEDVVSGVERGWPVPVLAELVQSRSNPLVCLATHGRTGVGGLLLGSVADELLPQITCPVVLVGHDYEPTDAPSFDGRWRTARAVLRRFRGLCINCVVGDGLGACAEDEGPRRDGAAPRRHLPRQPRQRRPRSSELTTSPTSWWGLVSPPHWICSTGSIPLEPSPLTAASLPATLVMTSTHGAGGLVRTALGSIGLRIAHHAPCPVVVRRPGVAV